MKAPVLIAVAIGVGALSALVAVESHVGVLLEEATSHVAHLRLDYPERATERTA